MCRIRNDQEYEFLFGNHKCISTARHLVHILSAKNDNRIGSRRVVLTARPFTIIPFLSFLVAKYK